MSGCRGRKEDRSELTVVIVTVSLFVLQFEQLFAADFN